MKILISGAKGLIGQYLVQKLTEKGHSVNILTRKKTGKPNEFRWDPAKNYIEDDAFLGVQAIIHLAGASIAKKWTSSYKEELYTSRINGAHLIKKYCEKHHIRPLVYISASGTNYYGTFTSPVILAEDSGMVQQDFLAKLCADWEQSAADFSGIADRIVCIRTAMVLAKKGGGFPRLQKIINYNLGSAIGTGTQWMNWIHIDDLVNIYLFTLENPSISGAYNAVADEFLTNEELMRKLAKNAHKKFLPLKIPTFVMKKMFGEMSGILLQGSRVSNEKIKSKGFEFKYKTLDFALADLT